MSQPLEADQYDSHKIGAKSSISGQSGAGQSASGHIQSDRYEAVPVRSTRLKQALANDNNVLIPMQYNALQDELYSSIEARSAELESMVSLLLGVSTCRMSVREVWKSGSFNVAIPFRLAGTRTVYLRLPLPYRIGEASCPGNAEEKLRSEIAAYIWIEQHCPDVPIPVLHAFGLPDGSTFTHPSNTPLWQRLWWTMRRLVLSALGRPKPVRHAQRSIRHSLGPGFLLISEASGKRLALSWPDHCHDRAFRERLFRGLARVSISLNSVPLPRIGSLTFCHDASISLSNRPVNLYMQMLENEGIPCPIPRHRTYAEVERYIFDLFALQDSKLVHQPNAVHNQEDGQMQLAALTALRATMHHFITPELHAGPFYYTLTDLHQQNIFVDSDWNVRGIIDLEWAHSEPIQMQLPPSWLTSKLIDSFDDPDDVAEYEAVLEEYLTIYELEESRRTGSTTQASIKREVWRGGGFWYFHAVGIPRAMYHLFNSHIQPLFNKEHPNLKVFDEVFYWYWGVGAKELIDKKLRDKQEYVTRVTEAFCSELRP